MCSVFSHIYEPFAEDHDAMDWGNPGVLRICNNKIRNCALSGKDIMDSIGMLCKS